MRPGVLLALAALAVAAVTGCGSDEDTAATPPTATPLSRSVARGQIIEVGDATLRIPHQWRRAQLAQDDRDQLRGLHGVGSIDRQYIPVGSRHDQPNATTADLPVLAITSESLAQDDESTSLLTFSGDPEDFPGEVQLAVRQLAHSDNRPQDPPRETKLGGDQAFSYQDDHVLSIEQPNVEFVVLALRDTRLYTLAVRIAPGADRNEARALLDAVRASWRWRTS